MSLDKKNIINETIHYLFKELKKDVSKKKETLKVTFISDDFDDSKHIRYFEILLEDSFLNDKDVDLFDIEIVYESIGNSIANIKGEFYGADGNIFKEFSVKLDDITTIKYELTLFISEIKKDYDSIIAEYINKVAR